MDVVMEVADVPNLIPTGLKCLRKGGRLVEIGNSFPGPVYDCLLAANHPVYYRSGNSFANAIRLSPE